MKERKKERRKNKTKEEETIKNTCFCFQFRKIKKYNREIFIVDFVVVVVFKPRF